MRPGGGALDNDATLNIANSAFTNNTAGTNGGRAVVNFGTTTVKRSTFSGNTSPLGPTSPTPPATRSPWAWTSSPAG